MTDTQILQWIKNNLSIYITKALSDAKAKNHSLIYTADDLIAITRRETGGLIAHFLSLNISVDKMHALMKGDISKRAADKEIRYHGYGYVQIDVASFPEFVNSGDWKDPYKCYAMAISVLEGKRRYIQMKVPTLMGDDLKKAVIAAYNCGEGWVTKALLAKQDVDTHTADHNYASEVWRFKTLVSTLA